MHLLTDASAEIAATNELQRTPRRTDCQLYGERFRQELLWSAFPLWSRIKDWRAMQELFVVNSGWRQKDLSTKTPLPTLVNFHVEIQDITEN